MISVVGAHASQPDLIEHPHREPRSDQKRVDDGAAQLMPGANLGRAVGSGGKLALIEWAPYAVPGKRWRHERPMPPRRSRRDWDARSRTGGTRATPVLRQ
jgi:hypothetical protein